MWVVSAPLVSLTDIDRIFELLGLSDIVRWVHVGLGVYTVLALGLMGKKEVKRESKYFYNRTL